jgi:hypothetical protein
MEALKNMLFTMQSMADQTSSASVSINSPPQVGLCKHSTVINLLVTGGERFE